jgi:hypothetical protein
MMRTQEHQEVNRAPVYARPHGHGGIVFLSTIAFVFSLFSLLISGVLAYRFLDLREEFRNLPFNPGAIFPTAPGASTAPSSNPSATSTNLGTANLSGQFIQPAIAGKAQVELLSVSRVKSSLTSNGDIVKVQFRVQRNTTTPIGLDYSEGLIYSEQTIARNPATGEIYRAVNPNKTANTVSVRDLAPGASTEASVALQVPANVNSLHLIIPKTETFENVPIAN